MNTIPSDDLQRHLTVAQSNAPDQPNIGSTRTTPPQLDAKAPAEFGTKAEPLAPKYRTELLKSA